MTAEGKRRRIRRLRFCHPDWTQVQIARAAGCHVSYVHRVLLDSPAPETPGYGVVEWLPGHRGTILRRYVQDGVDVVDIRCTSGRVLQGIYLGGHTPSVSTWR